MPYITSDVSVKVRSSILDVVVNQAVTTNHISFPVGSKVWPLLRSTGICFPTANFCWIWFLDQIMKMLHSISMEAAAAGKPLVDFRGVSIDWGYQGQKEKVSQLDRPESCQKADLDLAWAERSQSSRQRPRFRPSWSWTWSLWHRKGFQQMLTCKFGVSVGHKFKAIKVPGICGQDVPLEFFPERRGGRRLSQLRLSVVNVHIITNTDEFWKWEKYSKFEMFVT